MITWRNHDRAYGWIAIALHWLMALAIIAMFGLGLWMRSLDYYHHWYHAAPELHKAVGMVLFALLIFRLGWRWSNPLPRPIGPAWGQIVALLVHRLHYLLLLALMVSGYLIPTAKGAGIDLFGLCKIPALVMINDHTADLVGLAHRYLAWAVIVLAGLHAAAALKHHWIDRDTTLRRMLSPNPHNQGV